jgi:hypothetical protein
MWVGGWVGTQGERGAGTQDRPGSKKKVEKKRKKKKEKKKEKKKKEKKLGRKKKKNRHENLRRSREMSTLNSKDRELERDAKAAFLWSAAHVMSGVDPAVGTHIGFRGLGFFLYKKIIGGLNSQ